MFFLINKYKNYFNIASVFIEKHAIFHKMLIVRGNNPPPEKKRPIVPRKQPISRKKEALCSGEQTISGKKVALCSGEQTISRKKAALCSGEQTISRKKVAFCSGVQRVPDKRVAQCSYGSVLFVKKKWKLFKKMLMNIKNDYLWIIFITIYSIFIN